MMDDMELLREYATRGSELAFETLVRRHVNLVYSAAFRQVRDAAIAGEVTQTAFIILGRKAGALRQGTILSGWLYRTAQFAAARALRAERRRREHEQEAAQMEPEPCDQMWEQIAPLLEQAMARLGDADRNAVVLRSFENKSLAEVGAAMGANEDAARKRVSRAVEKLRKFFSRRGAVMPAVALGGLMSANAVQAAPVALAKSVTGLAIVKGATASGSTLILLKGALKLMAWTKVKTTILTGSAIILATMGTITVVSYFGNARPPRLGRPKLPTGNVAPLTGYGLRYGIVLASAGS